MSSTELDREPVRQLVADTILSPDFRRATFGGSGARSGTLPGFASSSAPSNWTRDGISSFPTSTRGKTSPRTSRADEIGPRLAEILDLGFAGIHLATNTEEIDIRTTKKGKVLLGRLRRRPRPEPQTAHNRNKNVPLPEGRADRVLEALGILTRDGQVRPTMRAKFTQVNEFLKLLTHVLDDAGLRNLGRPVEILDCGSGSSYLTLMVDHYLNDLLGIPARVMGVDNNEELIAKSIERGERAGAADLQFITAKIGEVTSRPDVVLALHACDTATDDALAQAVKGDARLLMSVPCCHHHLNNQLRAEGPAQVLRPLLRHGILQQRTADLVTDAFRALALRIMGYRTDVIEFISTEHTARNQMIRALRGAPVGEAAFVREYLEMRQFWGVAPYIEQALGDPFQRLLESTS